MLIDCVEKDALLSYSFDYLFLPPLVALSLEQDCDIELFLQLIQSSGYAVPEVERMFRS